MLQVQLEVPATVAAGSNFDCRVRISVAQEPAQGLIVWLPLPDQALGTVVAPEDFGQADNPTFTSATNGGQFTATGATVAGVVIPANSVYWNVGAANAGNTFVVTATLRCKAGTLNGTQLKTRSFAAATNAEAKQSAEQITAAVATKNLDFNLSSTSGIYSLGGQLYAQPGSVVGHGFNAANLNLGSSETLYELTVHDDLTAILSVIDDGGDGLDESDFIATTGGAVFHSAYVPPLGGAPRPAMVWTIPVLAPGSFISGSYQFRMKAAAAIQEGLTQYQRSGAAESSRLVRMTRENTVQFPLNETPSGSFALGKRIRGSSGVTASSSDLSLLTLGSGEPFSFLLFGTNNGFVALNDLVFVNQLPQGSLFSGVFLPPSINGSVFYSTTTQPEFTVANPPPVSIADPLVTLNPSGETHWKDLAADPPANLSEVTWVAFYIPKLSSAYFPDGGVTSVTAEINLSVETAVPCSAAPISNQARFSVFRKTPIAGPPLVDAGLGGPIHVSDTENHVITPITPAITAISSVSPNPVFHNDTSTVTYQVSVSNANSAGSADMAVGHMRLQWQSVMINGVPTLPALTELSPAVLIDGDPASGDVTVDFGALNKGQSRSFRAVFTLTGGGFVNSSLLQVSSTLSLPNTCTADLNRSTNATIVVSPYLQVTHRPLTAFTPPGGEIEASATVSNVGGGVATNAFVVVPVPTNTVFVKAARASNRLVYFSSVTYPAITNFLFPATTPSFITSNFTLGTHSDNGTPGDESDDFWTSPFGEATTTVAFRMDDPGIDLFPSPATREVRWTLRNDQDPGPGQISSPEGTLIGSEVGIFSSELLMAISNRATTYVSSVASPEFAVFEGADDTALLVVNGQSAPVDFGLTLTSSPVTRILSVKNVGSGPLSFSSMTLPSGYTETGASLVGASIAAGQTRTFEVRLNAAAAGTFSGQLRLFRFPGDSHPFSFPLIGLVTAEFPAGMFALGDFDTITAGVNDEPGRSVAVGQSVNHWLRFTNSSPQRLRKIVMLDKIPALTVFEALEMIEEVPTDVSLFYSTTTEVAFTAANPPPVDPDAAPLDLDSAGNAFWQNLLTHPPADPTAVTWIAVVVTELNSLLVPAQPGPKSALARLQLRAHAPDACNPGGPVINSALARVYEKIPLSGLPVIPADDVSGYVTFTDSETTALAPLIPQLSVVAPGPVITPSPLNTFPGEIEFTMTVKNSDEAGPLVSGRVELYWSGLSLGDDYVYPEVVSVSPSEILSDYSGSGYLELNLGSLASGESKTITLRLRIPRGIRAQSNYSVSAYVQGSGCSGFTYVYESGQVALAGNPVIEVLVSPLPAKTLPGGQLDYRVSMENTGDTGLYLAGAFMPVPEHVVLDRALGDSSILSVRFTDQPPPAEGASSSNVANYFYSASDGVFSDNGTPADSSDDFWTSPFGEATAGVIFETLASSLPAPSDVIEGRWIGINDDDPGPATSPSPVGTVITARAHALAFGSDYLLFTSAPVSTTIGFNNPPVWAGYHINMKQGQTAPVALAKLLARASDPDGDVLSLSVGISTSPGGASITAGGTAITYAPAPAFTGDDVFQLVLSDGQSTTAAPVTVTVAPFGDRGNPSANVVSLEKIDGRMELKFAGISGRTYEIQRSVDLMEWESLGSVQTDSLGRVQFTDPTPPTGSAFYRVVSPP